MHIGAAESDEAMRELLRLAGDNAEERFKLAVRPIYGASERHVYEHIGSSVLIEIDGKKLIVTAAHIVDNQPQTMLSVTGLEQFVPLQNAFFDTEPPKGARERDHIDIAFTEMSREQIEALEAVKFVTGDETVPDGEETNRRLFTVIGYPNSRNKGPWKGGKVGGQRYRYVAGLSPNPNVARDLGLSGINHLFIDHQNLVLDESGRRVSPIGPVGLSGGAVIEIRIRGSAILAPRLAGIIIEQHTRYKALVATKIAPIIRGIREALNSD